MKTSIRRRLAARKRRMDRRLGNDSFPDDLGRPMMRATNLHYDMAERTVATSHGGIGLIHHLVQRIGLDKEINQHLSLLKLALPYYESDHVLNLAYNALCGGRCLDDLEFRRQDEAYLNAIGALRIPDPTTAGDFCRRFEAQDVDHLHAAIDAARQKVWAEQPREFFEEAIIDVHGTILETGAEAKEGIDRAYFGPSPKSLSFGCGVRLPNFPTGRLRSSHCGTLARCRMPKSPKR